MHFGLKGNRLSVKLGGFFCLFWFALLLFFLVVCCHCGSGAITNAILQPLKDRPPAREQHLVNVHG